MQTIRTMAEVYGQIKANYYQDKPDAELFEGAMKGMVSDLDPHSEYMDKKGYAEMKESTSGDSVAWAWKSDKKTASSKSLPRLKTLRQNAPA